jgi:Ca2+-transporting ATPase
MQEREFARSEINEVLKNLDSTLQGLSEKEASDRLLKYGKNQIIETRKVSPFRIFIGQFSDPMVIILLIAVTISFLTSVLSEHGEEHGIIDAFVILAIIVFNAGFGFFQEYKSEQALEALKVLAAPKALVKRDGIIKEIDSELIVPGDILIFESGDRIAADSRILKATNCFVNESILTGESMPVRKTEEKILLESPALSDFNNIVYQGTIIASGKGQALVIATGMSTRFGRIARMVQETHKDLTPLQLDLADLGKKIGIVVIAMSIIVLVAEVIKQISETFISMLLTSIALAVSAIPEGLPAVVTITLAIGVQRMAERKAIVKHLPSVETLGSVTVIASDKTGTLTKNEMTVQTLFVNNTTIEVTGVGYNSDGNFYVEDQQYDVLNDPQVVKLFEIGHLCSNTTIQPDPTGRAEWSVVGNPTEGAVLIAAEKAGISRDTSLSNFHELTELSFDSSRKRMTSVRKDTDGKLWAFVKGAPEVILPMCKTILADGTIDHLSEYERKLILEKGSEFARRALRLLAFAYREIEVEVPDWEPSLVEKELTFVGIIGMYDPPREEVSDAIKTCEKAGIRPIMITGDHELTAKAIAIEIGLITPEEEIISGGRLNEMEWDELRKSVVHCNVFARVSPTHKVQIVNALKECSHVVAMTGDGVNDAPAMKAADVGVSMGIRGADVTKETSDIVLVDDNFATIVTAVEKGREIYSNIRKFVKFMLCGNFDELFLVFMIVMLGLPLPLTAIQLLWLNLASDGFPALALGVDPPEGNLMDQPPRRPDDRMFNKGMVLFVLLAGFIAFLSGFVVFLWVLTTYGGWIPGITGPIVDWQTNHWNNVLIHARTAVFAATVTFELMFIWNCRNEHKPFYRTNILNSRVLLGAVILSITLTILIIYLPFMWPLFGTYPLPFLDWVLIIITSLTGLLIPQHKIFGHFFKKPFDRNLN